MLLHSVAKVMTMPMLVAMEMAKAIPLHNPHLAMAILAIPLLNLPLATALGLMAKARASLATLTMALPLQILLAHMVDLRLRLQMVKAMVGAQLVVLVPLVIITTLLQMMSAADVESHLQLRHNPA